MTVEWLTRPAMACCLVFAFVFAVGCSNGSSRGERGEPRNASISNFQAEILADGVVTEEELERATFATVECVRVAGASASDPVWRGELQTPRWDWGMNWPPGADSSSYERCDTEYLRDVQGKWVAQHAMTEVEEEEARQEVVACMAENNYEYPDYGTLTADFANFDGTAHRVYSYCMAKAWNDETLRGFLPE